MGFCNCEDMDYKKSEISYIYRKFWCLFMIQDTIYIWIGLKLNEKKSVVYTKKQQSHLL